MDALQSAAGQDFHIILAEDSPPILRDLILESTYLLGINPEKIHAYTELLDAHDFIQRDPEVKAVVVLDNITPESRDVGFFGEAMAKDLLRNRGLYPNLVVVSLFTSDEWMKYEPERVEELGALGCQVWYKHNEQELMMLWIGEGMRTGQFSTRKEWMKSQGIPPEYGDEMKPGFAVLTYLKRSLTGANPTEDLLPQGTGLPEHTLRRGCFVQMNARQILHRLGNDELVEAADVHDEVSRGKERGN